MPQYSPQVLSDCPPCITSTSPLPSGTVGTDYTFTFQAAGGTPPYQWEITSEMLPVGLALLADGVLSGKPVMSSTFPFTMQVSDSTGVTSSAVFSITIVPQPASLQLVRKSALVVESDKDISTAFKSMLEAWGYDVSTAHDGEEGLRLYGECGSFSVVLIKLRLPKKWDWTYESQRRARWNEEYGYGVELAKEIRQQNPSQRIIISAFSYQHERQVPRFSELKDVPILICIGELRGVLEKLRIYQAISTLPRADFLKLRKHAEWLVWGLHGWDGEDLLSEAMARTIESTESNDSGKHWNKNVSFLIHLKGAMRNIANAQRKKREQSETCQLSTECDAEGQETFQFDVASDDPPALHTVIENENIGRLLRMFKGDQDATFVLRAILKDITKNEIARQLGITRYRAAMRRIRLKLWHRNGRL